MGRAYLRVDPAMFERKVIQQHYPPLAYAAYSAILCLADGQPVRGRFRDERVLRALLGPLARQLPFLIEHRDLIPATRHKRCDNCPSAHGVPGQLYVDGWDEWQEGDWQVKERLARVRNKDRNESHGADRIESNGPDRMPAAIAESVVAKRGGERHAVSNGAPRPGYRQPPERLPGEAPNPRHEGQHPDCFVCGTAKVEPRVTARPRTATAAAETSDSEAEPPEVSFAPPPAEEATGG